MKNDTYSIPGSALGARSKNKITSKAEITIPQSTDRSLGQLATKVISAADWHISSITDENRSPKYRVDPEVSYLGNGSLSILSRAGKLVFTKDLNETNRVAFRLDQDSSEFYSSSSKTTLGSLNIDTVDGYVLNPISTTYPSTNFTPTKPWIKKLFPTLSNPQILLVTKLELVQLALFYMLKDYNSVSFVQDTNRKDMAQIIIDNQEAENRLFESNI